MTEGKADAEREHNSANSEGVGVMNNCELSLGDRGLRSPTNGTLVSSIK